MKYFFKQIFLVTIPSFIVIMILLEVVFRFVIPASEQPQNRFDEKDRLFNYLPGQKDGMHTTGWRAQARGRWHINNFGWNSPIDYMEEKSGFRIAVIGDSYIDAMQVDSGESYPSLLGKALPAGFEVYSFGICGAPLSQYLHMSRYAAVHFDPDMMIFNIVMNDFDESFYRIRPVKHWLTLDERDGKIVEIGPASDPTHSQYSLFKKTLKKSALFRYLYLNLNMKHMIKTLFSGNKTEYVENTNPKRLADNFDLIKSGTEYILSKIMEENPGRKILFVIDAPRGNIYADDLDSFGLFTIYRMMRMLCDKHGIELLDLTEPMSADYRANRRKFNSRWDNHWDEYGHEFVARRILERIPPGSLDFPAPGD